jgi:hypothetical protein
MNNTNTSSIPSDIPSFRISDLTYKESVNVAVLPPNSNPPWGFGMTRSAKGVVVLRKARERKQSAFSRENVKWIWLIHSKLSPLIPIY